MATVNESCERLAGRETAIVPEPSSRPLHRIATVRRQQGKSLRRVARNMRVDLREVRAEEDEYTDLPLSAVYRWQKALEVPVSDLLDDSEAPLSAPVLERARLVKLMKTAASILEQTGDSSTRRMAQTLVDQLVEIMPELRGISAWHAVGQRRSLDEFGRAAEYCLSAEMFGDV